VNPKAPSIIRRTIASASTTEQSRLQLEDRQLVLRLERGPSGRDGLILERAVLPLRRLPGFNPMTDPVDLSAIAHRHGFVLGRAAERIKLLRSPSDIVLNIPGLDGALQVLKLDRVVFTADGAPLEWRISLRLLPSDTN
jgi:DNA-binding GntR family transcriptional regulator